MSRLRVREQLAAFREEDGVSIKPLVESAPAQRTLTSTHISERLVFTEIREVDNLRWNGEVFECGIPC